MRAENRERGGGRMSGETRLEVKCGVHPGSEV